jgi:hypothetical protein
MVQSASDRELFYGHPEPVLSTIHPYKLFTAVDIDELNCVGNNMTYQAVIMVDIKSYFDVARSPYVNLLNRKRLIYYNRGVLS